MRNKKLILSLSAAALLVVVIVVIIVVRRRGRKVFLADKYRLNNNYYIEVHPENDWSNYIYYNGTLDHVYIRKNAPVLESDGEIFIEIAAVGELNSAGDINRVRIKPGNYIAQKYLNL